AALLGGRRLGGRLRGDNGTCGTARTAYQARSLVLVAAVGCNRGRPRRRRRARGRRRGLGRRGLGLGLSEAALGFDLGLALGLFFLAVALFLGLAAGLGGLALGLLDAFLAVAAGGFGFRDPAFLLGAHLGLGQSACAR